MTVTELITDHLLYIPEEDYIDGHLIHLALIPEFQLHSNGKSTEEAFENMKANLFDLHTDFISDHHSTFSVEWRKYRDQLLGITGGNLTEGWLNGYI